MVQQITGVNFKDNMDNMAGNHSLIKNLLVTGCASPAVEEDLKRLKIRDILLQFHEGFKEELQRLTQNLRALRKAHSALDKVINCIVQARKSQDAVAAKVSET